MESTGTTTNTTTTATTKFEWPPLESDPEIFNRYFHKIGLPENIEFDELWSLDYKEVQPIDAPVIGVIAAIRRPKGRFYIEDNVISYQNVPFYMKQEGSLDNACGLVAALHCIGNNANFIPLDPNSILGGYFTKANEKTPEERCKILEEDNQFKEAHLVSAKEGQSGIPSTQEKVCHHYIAFAPSEKGIVEFDGTLPGPVVINKDGNQEDLLDNAIFELRKRMELGYVAENLSILIVKLRIN